MLTIVKLALRISTEAFDTEIQLYIDDCIQELTQLGISFDPMHPDSQIMTAVIAYVKWKFGQNEDQDKWAGIYRDKIEKMQIASAYITPEDE